MNNIDELIEQGETLNNYYALHPGEREQKTADFLVAVFAVLREQQERIAELEDLVRDLDEDFSGCEKIQRQLAAALEVLCSIRDFVIEEDTELADNIDLDIERIRGMK